MSISKIFKINWPKYIAYLFKRKLFYSIRNSWIFWFYILNRKARREFKKKLPKLNEVQKRILADWKRDGIAITSVEELFEDNELFARFIQFSDNLKNIEIEKKATKKSFLKFLFPVHPILDFKNPFFRLALNQKNLDIVNSYFGLSSKFSTLTLNITMPVGIEIPPKDSQNWHRDPEDKITCKMFMYLTDVDENSGPFIYVKGSHYLGKYKNLFPTQPPAGSYPPEDKILKRISLQDIKVCTGKAGTIIFCETTGLHKGGFAKINERLMFTSVYVTEGRMHDTSFQLSGDLKSDELSPSQLFAVTK